MAEIEVRAARRDEAAAVASVLRDAFDADPLLNWTLRSGEGRDRAFRAFFDANVGEYIDAGRRIDVATVDGEPAGAALWTPPPGAQPSRFRDRLGLWGLRDWTGLWRFPRLWRLVAATEARYPRQPHEYLFMIGVAAAHQGHGLGSRLLAPALAECDAAGIPAYLEASSPRNVSLYERHGFRTREVLRLGLGAPPIFLMWRESHAVAGAAGDDGGTGGR